MPTGKVQIAWQERKDDNQEQRLLFTWRESGRLALGPHGRNGFGRMVLEEIVPGMLGGAATFAIGEAGALWTRDVPADKAVNKKVKRTREVDDTLFSAASLFNYSDADGNAATAYEFWDSTRDPASGYCARLLGIACTPSLARLQVCIAEQKPRPEAGRQQARTPPPASSMPTVKRRSGLSLSTDRLAATSLVCRCCLSPQVEEATALIGAVVGQLIEVAVAHVSKPHDGAAN